jgi:hypothetical protein
MQKVLIRKKMVVKQMLISCFLIQEITYDVLFNIKSKTHVTDDI